MNICDCKSGEINSKGKKVEAPIEEEQAGNEVACVRWDILTAPVAWRKTRHGRHLQRCVGMQQNCRAAGTAPLFFLSLSLSRIPFPSLPAPSL